jgi:hypothetical protein
MFASPARQREVIYLQMIRNALATLVLALMATALTACDDKNSGSGNSPPPGAKPGHLSGKLSDAQGKPLSNVTIHIFGFSDKGEPVDRAVTVKGPATEYDIQLPDGKYNTPSARIGLVYNDRWYDLPLASADGTRDWSDQQDSKRGMVRDFVWKISGKVPGADTSLPAAYWGGTIQFSKGAEDLGEIPTIEINLTPDGPLIDGSKGEPMQFVRKLPWTKQEDHYLFDVPIGKYTATARILFGSQPKPLRLASYTIDPTNPELPNPEKLPPKVPIEFQCQEVHPGEYKLLMPNLVAFPPQ